MGDGNSNPDDSDIDESESSDVRCVHTLCIYMILCSYNSGACVCVRGCVYTRMCVSACVHVCVHADKCIHYWGGVCVHM